MNKKLKNMTVRVQMCLYLLIFLRDTRVVVVVVTIVVGYRLEQSRDGKGRGEVECGEVVTT